MSDYADIAERDYDIGKLLASGFKEVFGRRFLRYFVPVLILLAISSAMYALVLDDMRALMAQSAALEAGEEAALREFWRAWRAMVGMGLLVGLVSLLVVQYLLLRMGQVVRGEEVSVLDTLALAADPPRYLSLVLSAIVAYAAVLIGSFVLVLPGIALAVIFTTLPACVAFHERRFSVPIDEPFRILARGPGQVFGAVLALIAILFVAGFAVTLPLFSVMMADAGLFSAADPEAAMQDYYTSMLGGKMLAFQLLYLIFLSPLYLVLGFVTVLLYHNLRRPRAPAAAQESESGSPGGA